jgi:hypothetical protein
MVDSADFEGAVKPSSIEKAGFEADLYANRFCEIPTNMEGRWEYDANDNCIYAGYAPKGLPEGTDGWLIQKFTWTAGTVSGFNCTKREINYSSWTSHTF